MAVSKSFIGASFLIQIGDPKPNCIYFAGGFFRGNEMSKTEWITLITQQMVVSYPAWRNKDRNYALQGSFCASFMEREGIKSGDLLLLEYAGKRRFEVHILSSNVWDASPMWVGREGRMMAEQAFHRNVQICGVLSHESDDDEEAMRNSDSSSGNCHQLHRYCGNKPLPPRQCG